MKSSALLKYCIAPLTATILVDQLSKAYVLKNPMGLDVYLNQGVMAGALSASPEILRVVTLSTGGAFLLFIFAAIQYFLQAELALFRTGLSLLTGGILGNVIDRITKAAVVDFLTAPLPFGKVIIFNLADFLQWVGLIIMGIAFARSGERILRRNEFRKTSLVDLRFQLKFTAKIASIGLFFSIISGVFSYTFLKVTIAQLVPHYDEEMASRILFQFVSGFTLMSLIFWLLLLFVGFRQSHRLIGPIHAFERFLSDLFAGNSRTLKLRAGDEFKRLEQLAEELRTRFRP